MATESETGIRVGVEGAEEAAAAFQRIADAEEKIGTTGETAGSQAGQGLSRMEQVGQSLGRSLGIAEHAALDLVDAATKTDTVLANLAKTSEDAPQRLSRELPKAVLQVERLRDALEAAKKAGVPLGPEVEASMHQAEQGIQRATEASARYQGAQNKVADSTRALTSDAQRAQGVFGSWGSVFDTVAEKSRSAGGANKSFGQSLKDLGPQGETAGAKLGDLGTKAFAVGAAFTLGYESGTKLRETFPQIDREVSKLATSLVGLALGTSDFNRQATLTPVILEGGIRQLKEAQIATANFQEGVRRVVPEMKALDAEHKEMANFLKLLDAEFRKDGPAVLEQHLKTLGPVMRDVLVKAIEDGVLVLDKLDPKQKAWIETIIKAGDKAKESAEKVKLAYSSMFTAFEDGQKKAGNEVAEFQRRVNELGGDTDKLIAFSKQYAPVLGDIEAALKKAGLSTKDLSADQRIALGFMREFATETPEATKALAAHQAELGKVAASLGLYGPAANTAVEVTKSLGPAADGARGSVQQMGGGVFEVTAAMVALSKQTGLSIDDLGKLADKWREEQERIEGVNAALESARPAWENTTAGLHEAEAAFIGAALGEAAYEQAMSSAKHATAGAGESVESLSAELDALQEGMRRMDPASQEYAAAAIRLQELNARLGDSFEKAGQQAADFAVTLTESIVEAAATADASTLYQRTKEQVKPLSDALHGLLDQLADVAAQSPLTEVAVSMVLQQFSEGKITTLEGLRRALADVLDQLRLEGIGDPTQLGRINAIITGFELAQGAGEGAAAGIGKATEALHTFVGVGSDVTNTVDEIGASMGRLSSSTEAAGEKVVSTVGKMGDALKQYKRSLEDVIDTSKNLPMAPSPLPHPGGGGIEIFHELTQLFNQGHFTF